MARYLAIDFDHAQARILVAQGRSRRLSIDDAMAIPLPPSAAENGERAAAVGAAIRDALAARRVRTAGATVLCCAGRGAVELRALEVESAPDEELPHAVREQAQRVLGTLGEEAVLDFLASPIEAKANMHVVAAAMSARQLEQFEATWRAAGLKPSHLVLRPMATASLLIKRFELGESGVLLVNSLGGETDLTALVGDRVVLTRTVRSSDKNIEALVLEIRRTLASIAQQEGAPVEAIYVCGHAAAEKSLAESVEKQFSLPVRMFDPLEGFRVEGEAQAVLAESDGRFAPLAGMIADEMGSAGHGIDFLHPRRPPRPHNRRRTHAALAAAVAILVLLAGGMAYRKIAALDSQVDELVRQSKELDTLVKQAEERQKAVATIDEWAGGEVIWLDELYNLSTRLPSARDAMLGRLTLARSAGGGGVIDFEGLVRDPAIVARMESNLRDPAHEVRSKRVEAAVQDDAYTWKFQSSVTVDADAPAEYVGRRETDRAAAAAKNGSQPTQP